MKKSIFKGMFALVFLVAAGYGVKLAKNHTRLSYLAFKESYKVVIFGIGECGGIS